MMEKIMCDIHRAIGDREFNSIEEANAFLATLTGTGLEKALKQSAPLSANEEAQELTFEAMEAETAEKARELALRALAKDPDCVDAIMVLTDLEATSPQEAIAGLEKAVPQASARSGSVSSPSTRASSGVCWKRVLTCAPACNWRKYSGGWDAPARRSATTKPCWN
jgi:hypothetical protein